jgi:hypothetical protein
LFPLQEGYLKYPVRITLDGKPAGSGFFIEKERIVYLVTARHVLAHKNFEFAGSQVSINAFSNQEGFDETIEIRFDINQLNADKAVSFHPSRDILIIRIGVLDEHLRAVPLAGITIVRSGKGDLMVAQEPMFKLFDKINISQDVFLFGYPTSIGDKATKGELDLNKPLLRKGIVAGKNEKYKNLILDCPAFGGNSGGPITEVEHYFHDDGRYKGMGVYIIGIVTEYVPYAQQFIDPLLGVPNQVMGNSSYSIAEPMDPILSLLN